MVKQFLIKLLSKLKTILKPARTCPVVYNANSDDKSNYNKRALLIYIVKPFLIKEDDPLFIRHQHSRQCKQIAALLGESGYIVDVVDIRDRKFIPSGDYDLVICNRVIDTPLRNNPIRIYLATTLCHVHHNNNLRRRHKLLFNRRECNVEVRRTYSEKMPYVAKSDAIVGFGNELVMSTWKDVFKGPIYPFNNYGFKETGFYLESKDFSTARKNFLFFASRSQLQKGLDLLLEIFPKYPDLNLYICSQFEKEKDFCTCYHKQLYETANIHPIGWVRVNSSRYNDLVNKCAYVIHPTCSEGQPGSVVQCMYSGLIPVVTKEAGIDTEDFGITFPDDRLEEIERVILELSRLPESWHKHHSFRTRKVCEQKYSEDAFLDRWKFILNDILSTTANKNDFP